MSRSVYLTMEATETDEGSWTVTEDGSETVGEGATIHAAVIDYTERARERSRQKVEA